LKKVQRFVRFPYTVFMFIAGLSMSFHDARFKSQNTLPSWCTKEIMVFSAGTLGMSAVLSAIYAFSVMDTKSVRYSVLFGIFLCSNERIPIADELFEQGRCPILRSMLQAESIMNNVVVWSFLRQMSFK
ncbi:unnamed protein product, partial [Ixodes hexagonus]